MSVGEQIKKVRLAKGLSQKEVVMGAGIDKAQFSRIENDKIDPSFSTIEKIAKAMGCSIAELFASAEELKDINSHDKSLMEKLILIETLSEEEKLTLFNILDAFISKKKYKDTLSGLLNDDK
jgi:transcriptional regulator with XRE-family HTH domain